MWGQPSKSAEGTAQKPSFAGQEWATDCSDPQECCLLTDVLAAKLRVIDEAAHKGRQHDPGLPDKVAHIEGLTDGMAPRFRSSFASRRRSFALSKDRASLKHPPRFTGL